MNWQSKQRTAAKRTKAVHPNKGNRTPKADRPVTVEGPLYGLLDAADRAELERRRAKFAPAT